MTDDSVPIAPLSIWKPVHLGTDELGQQVHVIDRLAGRIANNLAGAEHLVSMDFQRAEEIRRQVEGSEEILEVVQALERQYDAFAEGAEPPTSSEFTRIGDLIDRVQVADDMVAR